MNRCPRAHSDFSSAAALAASVAPVPYGPPAQPLRRVRALSARLRLAAAAAALAITGAHAQTPAVRDFPPDALRGTLQVTTPPQVLLDGKPDRLAPAARIASPQNMMVMSGAIVGQKLVVNYVREPGGGLQQVWLLTPQEVAVRRPTAAGDGNFILKALGLNSQPSGPPRDDGKTPYNQLPAYPRP